jgi:(p)ppGpp synthase/HD superfamily hydrolase
MPTLEDAIALAADAHRGQRDKSGQPYILHPIRVMLQCRTEEQRIAAVLHDVVEDTGRSFDDLRDLGYPEDILRALDCLTKRDGEPYEAFVERAASDPIARVVKIADIEDNMDLRRLPGILEKDVERIGRYVRGWRRLNESLIK